MKYLILEVLLIKEVKNISNIKYLRQRNLRNLRYDNLNLQHLSTTCKQTSEERYTFSIESVQHPDT